MSGLADLDVPVLLDLLRRREVSAVEVLGAHLERIAELDRELHAFLSLNPRAEEEARALDASGPSGEARPLHGLPVAIKDNIATERLATTCGSRLLEGFIPMADATAVARLKAAGAIVLGKTNLDEFAMGSSTENSAFGPTRNPWDLARVPGGSSGGSAAAVSAGMVPAALGTDTGGSVRQPAAFCGLVGLKPTYGRVSRLGLVAFASSLDQVGPFATTVAGCARLLEAIAGTDPEDSTSSRTPIGDYARACGLGVKGLRIGLPREYFGEGLDPEVHRGVQRAAAALEREGAQLEGASLPHTRYAIPTYYVIANAEASSNLARYDGVRYGLRADPGAGFRAMVGRTRGASLGAEVKRRIMLGTFALSTGSYDEYYGRAMRARTLLKRDFQDVFASGIDALLVPTTPALPFRLGEKAGDPLGMYLSDVYSAPANLAGIPGLSVPAGLTSSGLPIGAQLLGPDFSEEVLFRIAAAIEAVVGRLVPPLVSRPGARPQRHTPPS